MIDEHEYRAICFPLRTLKKCRTHISRIVLNDLLGMRSNFTKSSLNIQTAKATAEIGGKKSANMPIEIDTHMGDSGIVRYRVEENRERLS